MARIQRTKKAVTFHSSVIPKAIQTQLDTVAPRRSLADLVKAHLAPLTGFEFEENCRQGSSFTDDRMAGLLLPEFLACETPFFNCARLTSFVLSDTRLVWDCIIQDHWLALDELWWRFAKTLTLLSSSRAELTSMERPEEYARFNSLGEHAFLSVLWSMEPSLDCDVSLF